MRSKYIEQMGLLLVVGLLLISGCEKDPLVVTEDCSANISQNHPNANEFQQILDKYVGKGLPGIVLLVRDSKGKWVGSAGFADIGKEIPMRPCHVSKVASITKPFVATLTMMLVEDSLLQLDDKVGKYLPSKHAGKVRNGPDAKIRQLMNHSSGIYDVIRDNDFYLAILNHPKKEWTQEELLEYVYYKEAYFPPGDSAIYSNTNYILLSMILEEVTGKSTNELLHNRIFEPLGMEDTYYDWHDQLPPHTAQGYYDLHNNGRIKNMSNYSTGNGNGYNGIYSTVQDLQTFIEALMRDKMLLASGTVDRMRSFLPYVQKGKRFGLGIYKDFLDHPSNTYAFGHRGRDLAYTGDMFWFPQEDVTFVTLVNYGTNAKSELHQTYFDYREEIVTAILN